MPGQIKAQVTGMTRFIARLCKEQEQRLCSFLFLGREKDVKESWAHEIFLKHKAPKWPCQCSDSSAHWLVAGVQPDVLEELTPFLWESNQGEAWLRRAHVPEPQNSHLIQGKQHHPPRTQMLLCSGFNLKTGFSPVQFTWRVQKAYFSFQQRINTNVRSCQGTDCHPPTASLPSNTWRILYFTYRPLILCSAAAF